MQHSPPLPRGLILITLVASSLLGGALRAQSEPPPDPPPQPEPLPIEADPEPPPAPAPARMPDLQRLASDALIRATLIRLRNVADPNPLHYRAAALAIRIARRAYPDDEGLLRLELQAWLGAADEEETLRMTRDLVRMNPDDTVAQLRLVSARIKRLQDADSRLAAYDRILGDDGSAIDASIRSRLALDAALLARETGDEPGFVRRLTIATTLDNTNKDAAALYSTYFFDRTTDPVERADLLANVILADPIDQQAHTNLARELFRRGAYAGARRFMHRAGDIAMSGLIEPSVDDLFDRYLLVWMTDGDQAALDAVMILQNRSLAAILDHRMRMERQGIDAGEEPEPTIPHEIELIRLAIAWSRSDAPGITESARRILLRLEEQIGMLDRKDAPYDTLTPEQDQYIRDEARLQRTMARLWAGEQLDEAQADIDALLHAESINRPGPVATARITGLMALRRGELDRAQELLAAAGDDPPARLGLAQLAEQRNDRPAALRIYAHIALSQAHRLVGCAAKKRIEHLLAKPLPPTPEVKALEDWAARFAPWLDEVTTNPTAFMTLSIAHVAPRIDAFDRVELDIELRNVSRIPMSVGADLTFNSRILLSPRVIIRTEDVSQIFGPEPIELDQRIRLMPGQSIKSRVWASRGSVGKWLELFADKSASIRWRAIQGYRIDPSTQGFAPGIISVTAQSDLLHRDAIAPRDDTAAIKEHLTTAQGRDLLEEVLRAVGAAGTQATNENDAALLEKCTDIAAAVARRVPSLTSVEKAWVVSVCARVQLLSVSTAILNAAKEDPSPLVQAALAIDGYSDPDDPALLRAREDPDPDLRGLARAVHANLKTGGAAVPARGSP